MLLRETRDTTRVSSGARAHLLMREQLKWHDEKADNSPWINALAELRQRATREGHCFQQVQAITVAIDQYARARSATATTFSTSPTVWDRAPTKCGDTSLCDATYLGDKAPTDLRPRQILRQSIQPDVDHASMALAARTLDVAGYVPSASQSAGQPGGYFACPSRW